MKTNLLILLLLIFATIISCKSDNKGMNENDRKIESIENSTTIEKEQSHNILELYEGYSKSDFIPYKEIGEDLDKKLQKSIYEGYLDYFKSRNLKIVLPYDYLLSRSDAKSLIYNKTELKEIQLYHKNLEAQHLDSIQDIKNKYSDYLTTNVEYRYDDVLSKKVKSKTENKILYKGENIATELITHKYENDKEIDRYKFESKGFDYSYYVSPRYGLPDEKFSTLKLKPYRTPGKYPNVPDYTPFSKMSNLDLDGWYHLFGSDHYELSVSENSIITFNIMSTLKENNNCRQFIHLLDNEYDNGILTHSAGDKTEFNFRDGSYVTYRFRGPTDTIYYEHGTIRFDGICQNSNIEYDLTKTINSSKSYDLVSSQDLGTKKMLVQHKVFDKNGNIQNQKTYFKDGSLKENISY